MGHRALTSEEEMKLVLQSINKDREAFAILYDCYFERIYFFIRGRIVNATEAEDLTEQVFLNAWRGISSYQNEGSPFTSWLYRLARNIVVDHFRQVKEIQSLDDTESRSYEEPVCGEDGIEQMLSADTVSRVLQTLTEEQRQVVILRLIDGLSSKEAGEIMGKNEGSIRALQFRAVDALRNVLRRAG